MENIKFDKNGLIPAIIQNSNSGEVLMLAYMNEESYKKTLNTGYTWFYSRSRQELWNKGAVSGNTQKVKEISYDCDGDTLLIKVEQKGPACHTGKKSCFFNRVTPAKSMTMGEVLFTLDDILKDRKTSPVEGSYTAYLYKEGVDKILKKVGEECAEVIIAAKNPDKSELIYEASDLIYHLLVLLKDQDVELEDIKDQLMGRMK
ncbi:MULTISPECIES: bifunctional phosphoribosyl-AMP cyclohydrolase/phosphoribosyl-ATP diphosphatase HisIE [Psychrilyobacter]|uniref:Histidine biosynthesis bifunctional protein HisIE n=1 Tax=Psychrilyobacter piezotolerans TaxID=2293438 RepID=A0ABX9KI21_9FUSO|nr:MULTISPECIES: bifunctional phosphoribosyl-AMP cyclohydrolase/phosphoribosyl-ATP diphosphatase HisIE [Psychrilyobacter]MCS5421373.1 bifunctional phosphoribosyl-AMP cyclohydrolase/phosphoribosyl-ATP diphosphatase HisIE [Psychrilyobacter sp. S5]NDI77480.1 bifunctional phosphoribosyl-AMP cyclohydrolase/phosphoribosyl-ATP diphosphatase HisIE [Psychrilyobacter piezotolerans]RDE63004.1 bifunctional phosphoribosyl-AMP cyclohydrolase/phosphoribosyl-ATP diphosphatase HisIE [Psychrilyobacter sp. S5]REI